MPLPHKIRVLTEGGGRVDVGGAVSSVCYCCCYHLEVSPTPPPPALRVVGSQNAGGWNGYTCQGRWLLGAVGGRPRGWLGEWGFVHSGSLRPHETPRASRHCPLHPQMRFREAEQLAQVTQRVSDGLTSPQQPDTKFQLLPRPLPNPVHRS